MLSQSCIVLTLDLSTLFSHNVSSSDPEPRRDSLLKHTFRARKCHLWPKLNDDEIDRKISTYTNINYWQDFFMFCLYSIHTGKRNEETNSLEKSVKVALWWRGGELSITDVTPWTHDPANNKPQRLLAAPPLPLYIHPLPFFTDFNTSSRFLQCTTFQQFPSTNKTMQHLRHS